MLRKVFKTILVLCLCAGLTIPTNAAISVSDGSAFVTKAEFAADLNNLSNRMAQLENSLDAKIDSLVSSYLTRNGIWNGAKQETLLANKTLLGNEVPKVSNWLTWWSKARPTSDLELDVARGILYYTEYPLVNVLNKTGMVFGEWDISVSNSVYYSDVFGITLQSNSSFEKNVVCFLSFYEKDSSGNLSTITRQLCRTIVWPMYNEYNQGNNKTNSVKSGIINGTGNTYISEPHAGYAMSGTVIGFVSKGNSLVMRAETQFNFNGANSKLTYDAVRSAYMWDSTWLCDGFYIY